MHRGFLLVILVVIGIPSCVSQNGLYETCRQPFECGTQSLTYPFYGVNRGANCGYPGFNVTCQDNIPLINISSIIYRVLDINNGTKTLRVARDDLWSNLSAQIRLNLTLTNNPFYRFPSSATDQDISLIYACTNQTPTSIPSQFNCASEAGLFFISTLNVSTSFTCAGPEITEITVRVSQTAATELERNPSAALLQTSLQSGFSVEWSADDDRCRSCVGSGGTCGSELGSGAFACHCANGSSESTCTNGSREELSNAQKYAIAGALICVVILVILPIISYFAIPYISTYLKKKSNPDLQQFLANHGSLAQKRYTYFEIKKITKSFKDKLGQGGFGTVYKGNLPDGQPVAVKVLARSRNDKDAEDFINEVASISRTSHVNIVNLLGFCYGRNKRALVYEFMPNKSLDSYINNAELSLEWNKLFEIAVGVARGLEYLHRGCNTRIVHFDIKPQNILLDEDFSPKISDFGLAKLCMKKQSVISMLGMRGTIGYIAPEVFSRNFGVVSHKSDVYSYGMMLLEMAGARKVVEMERNTQSSESYFPDNVYEHVLLRKETMDDLHVRDEKEESEMKMLMVGIWCIQTAPSDRPSMSKVLEMLEGSLQSIQIPPKPFFPLQSGAVEFSSSVNMDSENSTL